MARSRVVVDVEVNATKFAKLIVLLSSLSSFLVSLALAIAVVGATYCLVVEVRHAHRSFIHE